MKGKSAKFHQMRGLKLLKECHQSAAQYEDRGDPQKQRGGHWIKRVCC